MVIKKLHTFISTVIILAFGLLSQACAEKAEESRVEENTTLEQVNQVQESSFFDQIGKVKRVEAHGYVFMNSRCLDKDTDLHCALLKKGVAYKNALVEPQRANFAWFKRMNGLPDSTTLDDLIEVKALYVIPVIGQEVAVN